jgi:hypothetical protein
MTAVELPVGWPRNQSLDLQVYRELTKDKTAVKSVGNRNPCLRVSGRDGLGKHSKLVASSSRTNTLD